MLFWGVRPSILLQIAALLAVSVSAQAGQIFDFTSANGGFTPGSGWSYVAGTGWFLTGANNLDTTLVSPSIVSGGGEVTLQLTHSYNFENTFDTGVVELSVGGGAFGLVPGSAFTQNGYVSVDNNPTFTEGFNPGSGGSLVSIASLGTIPVGTNYNVRFHARYDGSVVQSNAWTISNLTLADDASTVPEPGSWLLLMSGLGVLLAGGRAAKRRSRG